MNQPRSTSSGAFGQTPKPIRRRSFLATSAGLTAATLTAPSILRAIGANDSVRVAIVGVRGRGGNHAKGFPALQGVEVAAVCDPDTSVREKAAKSVAGVQGGKAPEKVEDFRNVLDDKNIDALVVATPDHWHAPATIWGCQAGKDVYCEKPCSHNFHEGKLMVEAARKYNRVVQHGTQSRSATHVQEAIEFLHSGKLGRILQVKAINSQKRSNIGRKPDEKSPPAGVNYDLWLGPAPKRAFNPNRFHYNWHWFWDYGTGDTGNDGVHQIDIARWGLGDPDFPNSVIAGGGKFHFDDAQQTPDTQMAFFDYGDKSLIYEMRIWTPYPEHGVDNGNVFYGENGYMVLHRSKMWQVFWKGGKADEVQLPKNNRGVDHRQNFIDCMRTRKKPIADIEKGFHSSALAHLGNLSYRLGRRLELDRKTLTIKGDADANRQLGREYRKGFELSDTV